MSNLKIDVMLANSVLEAPARAKALEAVGVDGAFSFENAHDLFFPLVAAAPVCSLDLMTNVAIAFPRSPMHLANAAYDLQLLSKGRFRLGLGSQIKAHVEKRFGARWGKPVPQMREWVLATKAILQAWQDGTRVDFRGDYTQHTLMTPACTPVIDVEGWGDLQPELNALSKRGEWPKMNELITDDMVQTIAVHGTPDQCAAEIVARYGTCDRVCVYFPGYPTPDDLIADL